MQPAIFTEADVHARLPWLKVVVPEAKSAFRRLRSLGYRLRRLREDDTIDASAAPRMERLQRMVDRLAGEVEDYVSEIESCGGSLVDLETGEVTFDALIDGKLALYVWRPGNDRVLWFRYFDEPVGVVNRL